MKLHILTFVLLLFVLPHCCKPDFASAADKAEQVHIVIPASIYILEDESGGKEAVTDEAELLRVFRDVNSVWSQANIRIEIKEIRRLKIPSSMIMDLSNGNFESLMSGLGEYFSFSSGSVIKGFYAPVTGLVKGITPVTGIFITGDLPYAETVRVTVHELGHILSLKHVIGDKEGLMYPGSNGMTLTKDEIVAARAGAILLIETHNR